MCHGKARLCQAVAFCVSHPAESEDACLKEGTTFLDNGSLTITKDE